MRVKISGYRPFWSFDNFLDSFRFLTTDEKFYSFIENSLRNRIEDRLLNFSILGYAPFLAWKRKSNDWERVVKVRIDDSDIWSMDCTLAYIILPMLQKLKANKQGAPYVDMEDVPEDLRVPELEMREDVDATHFKRWDWVLDEMINAFNQINRDWEENFETGERDIIFKENEGTDLVSIAHGPNYTLVEDKEGKKAERERIDNGFRLFGKYYQALWD